MQNILRILRYVVFALIIVCNAIIASVAVWNQSASPESASVYAIDICTTCLAALGLVFTFTILFLELAGQDSVTGKVWFECTWVSALFIVNLAVASAASVILVTQSCIPDYVDACTSTQTLLSFSWLITFVLLIYALTLFASIYLVRGEHHDIWSTHVNQIPRLSPKHKLSSGPPTPVFATFGDAPSLVAPVPRPFRTFPMDDIYQRHSIFDPEYGIEGFEQQVHTAPRPIQRLPTLSDDTHFDPQVHVAPHPIQRQRTLSDDIHFEPQAHVAPLPVQRQRTLSDDIHFEPQVHIAPRPIQRQRTLSDDIHFEPQVHVAPRPIQRLPTLPSDNQFEPQVHVASHPVQRQPTLSDDSRFEPQVLIAARPIQRLPKLSISGDNHQPAPSFYPQFIQCALQSDPEAQPSLSAPERQGPLAKRMPSPPPLANWPRHDVLSQPVKSKCAKNSVDSNTTLAPNVSQHPSSPTGMPPSPEEGRGVGGAGP